MVDASAAARPVAARRPPPASASEPPAKKLRVSSIITEPLIKIKPKRSIRSTMCTKKGIADLDRQSREATEQTNIALFIDGSQYAPGASSFAKPRNERNVVKQWPIQMALIRLFCYLATKTGDATRVEEESAHTGRGSGKFTNIPSNAKVEVIWEMVPHKDPHMPDVGYRMHLKEFNADNFCKIDLILSSLIERNNNVVISNREKSLAEIRSREVAKVAKAGTVDSMLEETHLSCINGHTWKKYAIHYCPDILLEINAKRIADPNYNSNIEDDFLRGPFRVSNVFSLKRAMAMGRSKGAPHKFCDENNYIRTGVFGKSEFAFPQYDRALICRVGDLDPPSVHERFFPHYVADLVQFEAHRASYKALHRKMDGTVKEREDHDALLDKIFVESECKDTDTTREITSYTMAEQSKRDAMIRDSRPEFVHLPTDTERQKNIKTRRKHQEWDKYRIDVIEDTLRQIFNPENEASPIALRSIGESLANYLEDNVYSMFIAQPRAFRNLSRMENFYAMQSQQTRHIECMLNCSMEVQKLKFASFLVYKGVDLNLHQFFTGGPAVSKSHALLYIYWLFIEHTVSKITSFTNAGFTTDTRNHDYMIFILEEAQRASFCAGGKGAGNDMGNVVSMLKALLSNREMIVQTINMEKGTRENVTLKIRTTLAMFCAGNITASEMEEALRSRFMFTTFVNTSGDPTAIDDMAGMIARFKNQLIQQSRGPVQQFWRRIQMLVAPIMILIGNGGLPQPDPELPKMFMTIMSRFAAAKNIKVGEARDVIRLDHMLTVDIVLSAIHQLWCTPGSPFEKKARTFTETEWNEYVTDLSKQASEPLEWRGHTIDEVKAMEGQKHARAKKFELRDLFAVKKFLRPTIRGIVYCLGFLSSQYQDGTAMIAMQAMAKYMIGDNKMKTMPVKCDVEYNEDEWVTGKDGTPPRKKAVPASEVMAFSRLMAAQSVKPGHKKPMPNRDDAEQAAEDRMIEDLIEVDRLSNWMYEVVGSPSYLPMKVSANSFREPSQDDLVRHLAKQLYEKVHPKPAFDQLQAALRSLCDKTVKESRTIVREDGTSYTDEVDVNALVITPYSFKVARNALLCMQNDAFAELVEQTACFFHTSDTPRKYLYGDKDPVTPSAIRQITARRIVLADEKKEYRRIWNPNHGDKALQEVVSAFLRGCPGGDKVPVERMFESHQFSIIDVDVDRYAALKHLLINCGMTEEEGRQAPSCFEDESDAAYHAYWDRVEPEGSYRMYPKHVDKFDKEAWKKKADDDERANPDRYRLSSQINSLKAMSRDFMAADEAPESDGDMEVDEEENDEDEQLIQEAEARFEMEKQADLAGCV